MITLSFQLTSWSFQLPEVFKRNKHSNTLICLEGLTKEDLENVLDYIYNGELNIYQEELNRFLSVAQRLKLDGLLESKDNEMIKDTRPRESATRENIIPNASNSEDKSNFKIQHKTSTETFPSNTLSLNTNDMSEIDAKINENLEVLDDGNFRCRICGKDTTGNLKTPKRVLKQNMKGHIETHIEGLSYPCQLCGKEFRSKNSFSVHRTLKHKN